MPLKNQIEALLYASGSVMSAELLSSLTGADPSEIKKGVEELKESLTDKNSALMILHQDDGWKLTVREKYIPLVQKVVANTELGRATLETLAVIAFKAPALQAEVVKSRGTGAYEHIGELEKLEFIRREKEGNSYRVKLTEKFFEYFDIPGKDLKEVLAAAKPKPQDKEQSKLGDLPVTEVADRTGDPSPSEIFDHKGPVEREEIREKVSDEEKDDLLHPDQKEDPPSEQEESDTPEPAKDSESKEPEKKEEPEKEGESSLEDVSKEIDDILADKPGGA